MILSGENNASVCPLVTIAIPTYNRQETLVQALESSLAQDYPNLEIIISDNASTDGTKQAVEPYLADRRVRCYRNETNIGMVPNWRHLLYQYCRGEWFLLLSDDDYFIDATYITRAVSLIGQDPGILLVYASGYICREGGDSPERLELPYAGIVDGKTVFLNRDLYAKPMEFTLCNVLFNTALAKRLNAFSNDNNLNCDSELFLSSCLYGKVAVLTEPVTCYRFTSASLSQKRRTASELVGIAEVFSVPYQRALAEGTIEPELLRSWKERLLTPFLKHLVAQLILHHKRELFRSIRLLRDKSDIGLLRHCLQPKFLYDVIMLHLPWINSRIKSILRVLRCVA